MSAKLLLKVLVVTTLVLSGEAIGDARNACELNMDLVANAFAIVREEDEGLRRKLAWDLGYRTYQLAEEDRLSISQESVDSIAFLLSDRNDTVVSYAAIALSNAGPRAKSALPALRNALASPSVDRPDANEVTSTIEFSRIDRNGEIGRAIDVIEGKATK